MVYALAPAFGKTTLGANAREYGLLIGAMGAGAIAGVWIMRRVRDRFPPRLVVAATAFVYATCAFAMSRAPNVHVATVLSFPAGVGWTGTFSSLAALVQLWTPDRLRARIIALYSMTHLAMWAMGSTLGGAIADRVDIRTAMLLGSLVCFVTAMVTTRLPLPHSFAGAPPSIPPPAPDFEVEVAATSTRTP